MTQLNFVSLFAGAGGLDFGLEQAGWNCLYASDIDPDAVDTIKRNKGAIRQNGSGHSFGNTFVDHADVRTLSGTEIFEKIGGRRKGDITLLTGGPPCQSWSSAGHQGGLNDPRGTLFKEFTRIAAQLDVRWLLFENVRGLLTARGPDGKPGSALTIIRKTLLKHGFQTTVGLLNAADFGVAQRRVRLFMIGYRTGDEPLFPTPTHSKQPQLIESTRQWITLGECLSHIPPINPEEIIRPKGKLSDDLKNIQPGSGVKSPGKKEKTRPGGHWGYKQGAFIADLNAPARTVTANGQQDWIRDPKNGLRRLCPRECAAIQSFPSDWHWGNKKTSILYRLIGNAVPPKLAFAIGESLRKKAENEPLTLTSKIQINTLTPLPDHLRAAIEYTKREELANGDSRRAAPKRRANRITALQMDADPNV